MSTRSVLFPAVLALFGATACLQAQGTAFTYQGQLINGTNPATGNYDFRLQLYDAGTGGNLLAGPVTNVAVGVTNGLFTMLIDFGPGIFTGGSNWLHLGVRTNGGGAFSALLPRQQLAPTPYALFAENVNAAGVSGALPAGDLSGVSGSGLVGLNASQLTTGTMPDARLAPDVALTDGNQTFTGKNLFSGPGEGFIVDSGPISTSLFTGLGLQYYFSGEGAIMSSYNDGYGYLTFYTKQGFGYPIAKQVMIDQWGGVEIDQQGCNNGVLNNSTTNGVGLTFGISSGEGIASQRTAGGNQYGLDFYTSFSQRMSILNNGNVRINGHTLLLEPSTAGSYVGDGLVWGNGGLAGSIANSANAPFLGGFWGGSLGALSPNIVALSWDSAGNVGVNKQLTVQGEYMVVNGLTPVDAYIGDDGFGNDVQIGSQKSGVTAVACYNTADSAYMHLYCSSITIEGGADLAEPFRITSEAGEVAQGAVVVIDERNPGHLKVSDQRYDPHVAGVVSGANGINPGIQMQQQGLLEGGKNVALTGRVYVRADTSNGAIKPGDLLTTSGQPGRAMKVTDHARAAGAILGKAMTGLSQGEGMVLVLVTLQ
jgi:hypothetical protein